MLFLDGPVVYVLPVSIFVDTADGDRCCDPYYRHLLAGWVMRRDGYNLAATVKILAQNCYNVNILRVYNIYYIVPVLF